MFSGFLLFIHNLSWRQKKLVYSRGWFVTGLNTKIGIVQKILWPKWFSDWESFWEKDSVITFILFELCLFWYLSQLQIWCITLYVVKGENHANTPTHTYLINWNFFNNEFRPSGLKGTSGDPYGYFKAIRDFLNKNHRSGTWWGMAPS